MICKTMLRILLLLLLLLLLLPSSLQANQNVPGLYRELQKHGYWYSAIGKMNMEFPVAYTYSNNEKPPMFILVTPPGACGDVVLATMNFYTLSQSEEKYSGFMAASLDLGGGKAFDIYLKVNLDSSQTSMLCELDQDMTNAFMQGENISLTLFYHPILNVKAPVTLFFSLSGFPDAYQRMLRLCENMRDKILKK